jgi:hypothetical protein
MHPSQRSRWPLVARSLLLLVGVWLPIQATYAAACARGGPSRLVDHTAAYRHEAGAPGPHHEHAPDRGVLDCGSSLVCASVALPSPGVAQAALAERVEHVHDVMVAPASVDDAPEPPPPRVRERTSHPSLT